ncbi:hypothetical protein TI05_01585 [Achromatium sp. WMS3]|nr:hypothetical protein TI05_01585 [Achromatium sp. WMS3]
MDTISLSHILYTNASLEDNPFDDPFIKRLDDWPEHITNGIEKWTSNLKPLDKLQKMANPPSAVFAYMCFKYHVCLATIFPKFISDTRGRSASLTHVLVTYINEDADPNVHIMALAEHAKTFTIPPVSNNERFTEYEQLYTKGLKLNLPTSNSIHTGLKNQSKEQVLDVVKAAYRTTQRSSNYNLNVPDIPTLMDSLAICGMALPPRWRLHFYWGCGAASINRQANIITREIAGNQPPPQQIDQGLHTYLDKLWQALEQYPNNNKGAKRFLDTIWGIDANPEMVSEGWGINSLEGLFEWSKGIKI